MLIKLVKFVRSKHKISPWITSGILQSIQLKDNLYKIHKTADPNLPEYDVQISNLKTHINILKKAI